MSYATNVYKVSVLQSYEVVGRDRNFPEDEDLGDLIGYIRGIEGAKLYLLSQIVKREARFHVFEDGDNQTTITDRGHAANRRAIEILKEAAVRVLFPRRITQSGRNAMRSQFDDVISGRAKWVFLITDIHESRPQT